MTRLRLPHLYRGWWIVFTGYLAQLLNGGASGWVFGVLILPMQHDLGWSRSTIVGVLTVQRLVDGAFGIWLGSQLDKHGARLVMTLCALFAGACLIAYSIVQAPWQSYVVWAGLGLTMSGLSTVGPVVAISNWFIRKRTKAILFFTFGAATAGLVLAPTMATVAEQFGWRLVWVLMGLMLWALAPIAWTTIRHRPEDVGLLTDGDALPAETKMRGGQPDVDTGPERYWTVHLALRSRSFWFLALGFMLTSLPASSIFIHMSAFVQSRGFSVEAGAAAVSIYGFGALAGRFVWGFITTRLGLHRALVTYGALYGVSILLYSMQANLVAIYGTTILLGISVAGSQQLRSQSFPDYFGRRIVGSLLGYAGVIATLTGASAPLIAAIMFDKTGSYVATFVFFGACCLLAGAGFLFSKPRHPTATLQPATT